MSATNVSNSIGGGRRGADGAAVARAVGDWLSLAAAPAFAMMALMTVALGGGLDSLCSARASLMSGMAPMYLMMSAFHSAPWLRLIAGRRG
jgi:hypothetical protein